MSMGDLSGLQDLVKDLHVLGFGIASVAGLATGAALRGVDRLRENSGRDAIFSPRQFTIYIPFTLGSTATVPISAVLTEGRNLEPSLAIAGGAYGATLDIMYMLGYTMASRYY